MTVSQLVAAEQRRLRARLLVAAAALAFALALALIAVGAMALGDARWLALPRALPWLIWGAVIVAAAAVVIAARRTMHRDAGVGPVAAAIEQERAMRAGELRGALEVAQSGPLGALAAEQMAERLGAARETTLVPAMQRRAGRRAAIATSVAAVAALALAGSLGFARDGAAALMHPADAWSGTLLPPLRFDGLPNAVVRGERLRVQVRAPGRRHVHVTHRVTGHEWTTTDVAVDARGRAVVDVGPLDADVLIAATDGRAHADTARVAVTERAFLGDVAVRAEYPGYLGRAAETLPAGETVRVPRGTALTVSGRASTALSAVTLGTGTAALHLTPNGHAFSGRMVAEASGRWAWQALGASGPVADLPAPLDIEVVADSAPRVEIIAPTSDSTVDGLGAVRVALAASDDHGLAAVALRAWRERADGVRETPSETRLAGGIPLWSGAAQVDLAARALQPGDKLHVQAIAVDESPWRQSAASRELVLRVPSASELRAQARAAADTAVARAVAAAQAQKELAQRTNDAARSRDAAQRAAERANFQGTTARDGEKAMSYESAERAKGLAQEQRQLSNRVQQLQDQAKSLERQLKQAGALDSSLAAQLADVQRLLKDALTPELAKQLESLEQNASKLSSAQSQQALEQLAAQQRALRQQLEKSVEMLRRAALEGSMQTLRDEAKELATAQQKEAQRLAGEQPKPQPNDSANRANGAGEPPPKSQELAERSRNLTKDVEELTKRLRSEKADVGAQRSAEAQQHADKSADAMERAARQNGDQRNGAMRSGDQQQGDQRQGDQRQGDQRQNGQQPNGQQQNGQQGGQQGGQQSASRAAQEAAQEMQQAADRLSSARQGQIDAWKNELSGELDRAIQETMQLAREQADVEQQARNGGDPSQVKSAQAAVQQGVDQTAQRLDQAGRKSSLLSQRAQRALGDAKQQVSEATQQLQQSQPGQQSGSQGTPQSAANAMKEAGEALNRAAAALVRDRERVNGAQSASGFEEMIAQMRELAKQQGQINSQAAGLPMPTPGQGSGAGREAARQLARQQRGVAEKLDDLSDGDPTGRSDALAKEARQLAQQLERQGVDPQTAQRQQQLYKRLLDAGRTLEQDERDESGKREAHSGNGITSVAPADGATNGRAATKFQAPDWTQLRGLSADERRLVIEYFRRLNAGQSPPQ